MTDDVVEHLAAVNVLEDHVVMVLVDDHLAHAADVGMVEEHRESCFPECTNLLRGIFRCLLCRSLGVGRCCNAAGSLGSDAWEDLDGKLRGGGELACIPLA